MYDENLAAPISSAEAFNILQKSAMNGYMLSSVINRAANMTAIDAKKSEATNLKKQVEGEREHAAVAFGAAVVGALAGVAIPIVGSRWSKGPISPDAKRGPDVPTPGAGAPGAGGPGGAGAAVNIVKPKVGAAHDVGKGKAGPNGKAPDADAPSNVPGSSVDNTNVMAAKTKMRDAQKQHTQQTAQGGPSAQPASAPTANPSGASSGNPGGGGPNAGLGKADDKLDGISASEQRKIERGQAYMQAGQSFSAVITSGAEMVDKVSATGGQYQADVAKIAQKQDAIDAQVAELAKDSSKSGQEQALEVLKAAQQLTQSFSQRWTEVANNIANR